MIFLESNSTFDRMCDRRIFFQMRGFTASFAVIFFLLATLAHSQNLNTNRLEELRSDLADVAKAVSSNIKSTSASIKGLYETDLNDQQKAVFDMLDAIEHDAQIIRNQVKLNSPFMDELDRARAQVLVILRKQEREPPSPQRDNRVARLEKALAEVEKQYGTLQGIEAQITRSLSQHAQVRRDLRNEAQVQGVESFVNDLRELTANLEQMVAVLDEVSRSTLDVRDDSAIVQE